MFVCVWVCVTFALSMKWIDTQQSYFIFIIIIYAQHTYTTEPKEWTKVYVVWVVYDCKTQQHVCVCVFVLGELVYLSYLVLETIAFGFLFCLFVIRFILSVVGGCKCCLVLWWLLNTFVCVLYILGRLMRCRSCPHTRTHTHSISRFRSRRKEQSCTQPICGLVKRVHNGFAIRQLAHLHRTVGATREQTTVGVDLQLSDALTDVLEETAASVLTGKRVQRRVNGQSPNLEESRGRQN